MEAVLNMGSNSAELAGINFKTTGWLRGLQACAQKAKSKVPAGHKRAEITRAFIY